MGQYGRVWKWTGAVLAVLCAALGVASFLLTRMGEPSTDYADDAEWVNSGSQESGVPGPPRLAGAGRIQEGETKPPQDSVHGDVKSLPPQAAELKNNSALPTRIQDPRGPVQNSPGGGAPKSKIENSPVAIDNRQSLIINSIRPLGIVEMADGRVQAVIQDGEWTRLVEAGEVLADNSRVLKVSAEGVEILRPASPPAVELARAGNAVPGETKTEIAVAAIGSDRARDNDQPIVVAEPAQARVTRPAAPRSRGESDLPGMQIGEATLHASAPKLAPSVVPQRALKPVLPNQADLRPSPVVGIDRPVAPNAALGRVEYADGRVQSVVADGQWVKLVADPAKSGSDFNQAKGTVINETSGHEIDSGSAPITLLRGAVGQPIPRSGLIEDSESVIPNSVEPIGIVEWPEGRTQAVIIEGMSISLVDDSKILAETRRALALISSPQEPRIDPRLRAAEQAGRQRENELASLALIEDDSSTRGPPSEFESPFALPEELARGQPEDDELADLSRAPPLSDSSESSLLGEDLPGFEDSAAARTEPLQSIQIIPDAILGRSAGGRAGSVSEIHSHRNLNALLPLPIALGNAQNPASAPESSAGHDQILGPKVLGYVRMLDGRQRIVVSVGDSVMLVEQTADEQVVQTGGLTPAGNKAVISHPQTGAAHPTAGEPSGSGLQSGPRIRDNQGQSHR